MMKHSDGTVVRAPGDAGNRPGAAFDDRCATAESLLHMGGHRGRVGEALAIRFTTLAALCRELACQPGDLMSYGAEEP